jgi:asparagine synthase (glutamine-hydrolysing)
MCGIAGWLSLDGSPVDRVVVERMTRLLVHRGPDDEGFYYDPHVALAQRRLSIIDVEGGHQPLANEDGTVWVTYNGEIYNFPELMSDLAQRGHRFRTRADTEVIVHAYEEYGADCLTRLNGMFAFALWDQRARRLVLARDPFGIKPLYVWRTAGRLLFASEIKAFLADPAFERAIDPAALDEYLTFQFVPSPRTLFAGVQKIPPGHCMIVEGGVARLEAFARRAPQTERITDERAAVGALQEHLVAAVRGQMISDVPVGAMLSGGVDSATVVALMQEATDRPVKTFTVGFEGNFAKDEIDLARRSAAILGSEHHDVVISARDCLDTFEATIWHLDEPVATPSALAMYWVSRLAAQHVKVVLTGQGADEPWAGYRRYRGETLGRWYRRVPRLVRQGLVEPLVGQVPRAEALKRAVHALGALDPVERFVGVYDAFTPEMKRQLYGDARAGGGAADVREPLRYWQSAAAHLDPLAQQLFVETRFSLPDNLLLYGDKMAMAWSLEARVPLLDVELMSFVERLPSSLRLKGWSGHKYLYRQAIRKWLPEEILRRPKIGFTTPMDEWFQHEISGHVRERLTAPASACAAHFDVRYINALIREHAERREDHTRRLYSLLVFEYWYERFMRAPREARAAL